MILKKPNTHMRTFLNNRRFQYSLLCTFIGIWAFILLPHFKEICGLSPIIFPKSKISKVENLKIIVSSLALTSYTLFLGIRELKKPSVEKTQRCKVKILPLILICSIIFPVAYAYVYEQGSHAVNQTILDIFLLFDDFNEHTPPEAPDGWTPYVGTWQTVSDGSTVYEQTDTSQARAISYIGNISWTDYEFEVNTTLITAGTGTARGALLLFRVQDVSNYYFLAILDDLDQVRLYRRIGGSDILIQTLNINVPSGTWLNVRIRIEGQTINVWGNDNPFFTDVPSGGNLNNGFITLSTRFYHCRFDDVIVSPV